MEVRTELVLVCTDKYEDPDDYWVENIKYMLQKQWFHYDTVRVIRDIEFGGVYDKLQMFRDCTDKNTQYIYFDLDVVITNMVDHLLRKDLTILHAWWREKLHTPLNSSVMSWRGDYSFIYNFFNSDPEFFMTKYNKGIDQYLYEDFEIDRYEPVCTSYRYAGFNNIWPVILFNQRAEKMRSPGPWSQYMLSE